MPRVDASMVTSGTELPGYRVVENFGIVRGIIVRSRSVIGNLGAALQTIVGGNITVLTDLFEKTPEVPSNCCCSTPAITAQTRLSACGTMPPKSCRESRRFLLTARRCKWNASPSSLNARSQGAAVQW